MNDYEQVCAKVLEESKRFLAALPTLLASELRGRWVLFKDGEVIADFATDSEALSAGVARFGYYGGFVVDNVRPHQPILLFSSLRYF